MWGGRFAEGPSAIMREINASIPFDKALWRQDIAASKAHVAMLGAKAIVSVEDAQVIAESFREGIPVIINLSQMTEPEARRLVDFASGLSQGLYGKIERVTSKVFLLSPAHVAVSGDEAEPETAVDASFFAGA